MTSVAHQARDQGKLFYVLLYNEYGPLVTCGVDAFPTPEAPFEPRANGRKQEDPANQ